MNQLDKQILINSLSYATNNAVAALMYAGSDEEEQLAAKKVMAMIEVGNMPIEKPQPPAAPPPPPPPK